LHGIVDSAATGEAERTPLGAATTTSPGA